MTEQKAEERVSPQGVIERRLKQLQEKELPQAIALVHSIKGAIQLCEQLLAELNGKKEV